MQSTRSLQISGRGATQVVLVVAVALTGAAFGRWIVPAADSSVQVVRESSGSVVTAGDLVERKFAQIDARDATHGSDPANVAPIPASAVERKLTQTSAQGPALSDAANVAPIPASAVERKLAQTSAQGPALSDAANVAPIPDSAVERKLALTSTQSPALSDAANVAPIPASAVERKLERTGSQDATASADRYDEMFETKSAQMDAREDR